MQILLSFYMTNPTPKFSIVIPLFNEQDNLYDLDKEIRKVMSSLGSYEMIYINDGSSDKTLENLKSLKSLRIINLRRNYGQSIALDAGFKAANGEYIISMDGDMQNDPNDIPKLYKKLISEDLDVVAGWRRKRKDPIVTRLLTKTGRLLRKLIINDPVHDTGCTLRIYRREAAKSLDLWGEMHRYILSLLRWKGFKIGEIEVNHRQRKSGKTKYTAKKALRGFIDLLYIWFVNKFSNRPLHLFGSLGLFSFIAGLIIEIWMVIEKISGNIDLSSNAWFILGFFLMIMGIQFFISGILLDIQLRNYFNSSKTEKRYYVKDFIEIR